MALLAKDKNDKHNQEKLPNIYLKTLQEEPDYAKTCKESIKVVMKKGKRIFILLFYNPFRFSQPLDLPRFALTSTINQLVYTVLRQYGNYVCILH